MRLTGPRFLVLLGLLGIGIVVAPDQIVPATPEHPAQMRLWLAARASGLVTYLLLTAQIVFGLILSHPTNQTTWKLSKRLFPWHENLWIFVLSFLAAHIVTIILDPWAGVGIAGSFIPGLSSYRSSPVALGTLGLYALVITGLTARYTKLLPPGFWLKIHRLGLVTFVLSWLHGILSGTDTEALRPLYLGTGLLVLGAAAYRYWVARKARTFSTCSGGTLAMIPVQLVLRRAVVVAAVVLSLAVGVWRSVRPPPDHVVGAMTAAPVSARPRPARRRAGARWRSRTCRVVHADNRPRDGRRSPDRSPTTRRRPGGSGHGRGEEKLMALNRSISSPPPR